MAEELFRSFKNVEGRLMLATRDSQGNPHYQIWFDYTRNLVNEIREGDLIAVQNFSSATRGIAFSILSLTNVAPIHYALGKTEQDIKGYPGHVMEAAKNIAKDWKDQVDDPTEDVTKIVCEAVPTLLEFIDDPKANLLEKPIQEETSMPMPGEEVRLLDRPMIRRIVNLGIDPKRENTIVIGTLLRDDQIEVLLKAEDFLKLHFGLFGFTNVGKSNLLSTIIDRSLRPGGATKIVLFDLMDEYKGILFDQFLRKDVLANIVVLDTQSLPGPVLDYINGHYDTGMEKRAVGSFLDTLLLPRSLVSKALLDAMRDKAPEVLRKIRIMIEAKTAAELRRELEPELFKGSIGAEARAEVRQALEAIFGKQGYKLLTPRVAKELLEKHLPDIGGVYSNMESDTARKRIEFNVKPALEQIVSSGEVEVGSHLTTNANEIVKDLNDSTRSSLYLVTAFQHESVLRACSMLAWKMYGFRRVTGKTGPLVSFIADEADLFIPTSAERDTALAKGAIEMLARRGRKFGIGVGIATQRASYLDTKTMGQLHTYFVSKLPRKYDRDAVSDAFGMSEEQFAPTFKFRRGEWLVVSHDATGLTGVPIPIRAPNAEDRIRTNLGVGK